MAPSGARWRLAAAIVLGVVALDQLTKAWAVDALADGPVQVIGDDVTLRLGRNSGGAFGAFQGSTPVLALLALAMTVFLVHLLRRTEGARPLVALSLLLGGALGNLLDRLARAPRFLHGEVVDFVDVGWWPAFNLADSAITIGAVLLVVDLVLGGRRSARPAEGTDGEPG